MKNLILSFLFSIILSPVYSQSPGIFPRVLSIPDPSESDIVKVVDYQTHNCSIEPGCDNMQYSVLYEEFDYPANMPNIWRFDLGYTRDDNVTNSSAIDHKYSTWMGDALQYNTTNTNPLNSENFKFNSGILTLSHIYKPVSREGKDYNFTSGMIQSLSNFRTGTFEAKIKVPSANKMFPAFWLLSNKGPYTEIDIFEYFDDDVSGTSCEVYNSHRISTHNKPINASSDDRIDRADKYPQNVDEWHTYRLVWNDYEIKVYVDDNPVARGYSTKFFFSVSAPLYHCQYGSTGHPLDPARIFSCTQLNNLPDNIFPTIDFGSKPWWLPNWIQWPPPQPYIANRISKEKAFPDKNSAMWLIINNWANWQYYSENFSEFSQSSLNMEIDWVKVYQPFCCQTDRVICGLSDLDNQTYFTDILTGRKISIGNNSNSCSFSQNKPSTGYIPGTSEINWRDSPCIFLATDEIEINSEAIFPGETYAEMRIVDCARAMRINNFENEYQNSSEDSLLNTLNIMRDSLAKQFYTNYMDSLKKEYAYIESSDIKISPVPANDVVNITCSDWQYTQIKLLFLIDVNGKETEIKKERKLNIENLLPGTYFLKFQMDSNEFFVKKLIKL